MRLEAPSPLEPCHLSGALSFLHLYTLICGAARSLSCLRCPAAAPLGHQPAAMPPVVASSEPSSEAQHDLKRRKIEEAGALVAEAAATASSKLQPNKNVNSFDSVEEWRGNLRWEGIRAGVTSRNTHGHVPRMSAGRDRKAASRLPACSRAHPRWRLSMHLMEPWVVAHRIMASQQHQWQAPASVFV